MAATGLLALLDDIATLLDDVATMTKVATKSTAGVLGDDLALNAEQVSGVRAERELPVVWAVAKGSFKNKFILVPAALAISVLLPWLITPLLIIGGLYLCFEGAEKCLHKFFHNKVDDNSNASEEVITENINLAEYEKQKIAGAIRTDFILSAEIIVIALGSVEGESLLIQALVVSAVALLVTGVVYSLVAAIVKMDDAGLHLIESEEANIFNKKLGAFLLAVAPKLMKLLAVVGTIAMFLVGGGIIVHRIHFFHEMLHNIKHSVEANIGFLLPITEVVVSGIVGVAGGLIVLLIVEVFASLKARLQTRA